MRNYIFIYLVFFNIIQLFAQQKKSLSGAFLSGKISEKGTQKPLAGASVYIHDLKLGAIADSVGYYEIKNLPRGTYLIEIHSVGYKAVTKNITIKSITDVDFELINEYIDAAPVVVTGTSKAIEIRHNPIPIISIKHDFIANNLNTNIIDAIAKVPGVNALTTGPNVSKPFIRGLGYNRILTLYDGVRQEGQQWGDEHGIEVDQYNIDKVEVIKGPASLTYGSDALAGVVNLIPTQPPAQQKWMADFITEYHTNNGLIGTSVMVKSAYNGWEWMGRISHKQATNYQNKIDSRVYGTAFNETDATASVGLHSKWGYSHVNFSIYNNLQEIPDGSRDSATRKFTKQITEIDTLRPIVSPQELKSYAITPLHQHVQHYRIYATNNFTIGKSRLIANIAYQRSVRKEFSHPEIPYQNVPGLFLELNSYLYDLKYIVPEFFKWNITFGMNGMYQTNKVTDGTEFVVPSYHQFDIGPFAVVRKSFGKLDVSGGIRFDNRSFSSNELYLKQDPISGFNKPVYNGDTAGATQLFSNNKHAFSGFSGSLGFTYNFSDKFYLKANISRGYRAPNISEISSSGVHPGTNIYQIGNVNFKPEFSLQSDLGINYNSKYAVISISIFNNIISNYIFNQRVLNANGEDSVIIPGNQTFQFQQGKAQLYGGELSIDVHPLRSVHFENSLSVVYGFNKSLNNKQLTDANKYLPFIPPIRGISELRYDFEMKHNHITNGFLKLQLAYYASQNRAYLENNTETATAGYTLLNAGLGAGFTNQKGKTIFNFYIMGNNLLNITYQDHLNRLKYFEPYPNELRSYHGIYNMGRNIAFKIDIPLQR